jgi:hypothetical protein
MSQPRPAELSTISSPSLFAGAVTLTCERKPIMVVVCWAEQNKEQNQKLRFKVVMKAKDPDEGGYLSFN